MLKLKSERNRKDTERWWSVLSQKAFDLFTSVHSEFFKMFEVLK